MIVEIMDFFFVLIFLEFIHDETITLFKTCRVPFSNSLCSLHKDLFVLVVFIRFFHPVNQYIYFIDFLSFLFLFIFQDKG